MRITEICYGKNGNDLLFSFVLSTSELDSDYAIFFLNNEIKQYKSIHCSKTPGGKLRERFVFNNSFWTLNDDGHFVFQEYFEDCTIVQTIIAQIIKRITAEGFSKNYTEENAYDFFRDIRALELYWS